MAVNLRNRSFVKEIDLTPKEWKFLLDLAADLKAAKYAGTERPRLSGKNIALIFEKTGKPNVKFMHCLPAVHDRHTTVGEDIYQTTGMESLEVTDEMFESEHSIIFDQDAHHQGRSHGHVGRLMRIVVALGGNALLRRGQKPDADVQEANDPALDNPTKFVGEVYGEAEARSLAASRGWTMRPDGSHWRRVVGSPRPQRVVETRLMRLLLTSGAVVVCAGGGGVPVIRSERGHLEGVEAVVDKDLTSSVLAEALEADAFLVLTDEPCVMRGFGTPDSTPILRATPASLRREKFPAGSMGPNVDAVCRFVELTGDMAAIGRLQDAVAILNGEAGTIVTPAGDYGRPTDLRPRGTGLSTTQASEPPQRDRTGEPSEYVIRSG